MNRSDKQQGTKGWHGIHTHAVHMHLLQFINKGSCPRIKLFTDWDFSTLPVVQQCSNTDANATIALLQ